MNWKSLAVTAVAAMLLNGGAHAQTLHPLPPMGLAWKMKPNADQMAKYYPPEAQRKERSGWTVIECQTEATGDMKACKVLGESSPDLGFGDAGLKLSQFFKLDANKVAPDLLTGGVVTIPIIMNVPTGVRSPVSSPDVLAGQPSVLLKPAKAGDFPCPTTAAPKQTCAPHAFYWAQHPDIGETAPFIRAAAASPATTKLICPIGADMKLVQCMLATSADASQLAAMDSLIALFTVPAQADDNAYAKGGFVLMQFDWPALKHAVETSVLTKQP